MKTVNPSSLLVIILISLAVAPTFALGEGQRNLFLIGVMFISPIILIYCNKFTQHDFFLMLFMVSIVMSPLMNQPESIRWSTIFYSIMFGLTFLAYKQLLFRGYLKVENYQKLLTYLIYAYAVMLFIQQVCVLLGLPVLNYNFNDLDNPWKLNSLSAEPSHTARIVVLLMFSFISIKQITIKRKYDFRLDFKSDKWVWFSFFWTMLTMGSATSFLFIPIILLVFLRFRNILPIFCVVVVAIIFLVFIGNDSFDRTYRVLLATLTFDTEAIIEADHSASFRTVPILILLQIIDVTSINGWFGYGVDHVPIILNYYIWGFPEGMSGGGLLQLWVEYGFLSFVLFVIFSFNSSYEKGNYVSGIFWFMFVFLYGVNNQIVWLCIIFLFTNKYFKKM